MTADTSEIRGGEWYIAEGAVSRAGHTGITVNGSAHLVLWDGCDLKVTAAFEFTLMDGSDPVEIKNLTVKVKAMVRYTGALGMAEFAQATEAQVKVWLAAAGGKIKAELKQQEGVNAIRKLVRDPPTGPNAARAIPSLHRAVCAPAGAISPAEFEHIDIVDGKAYLGVSVYTNSEVILEKKSVCFRCCGRKKSVVEPCDCCRKSVFEQSSVCAGRVSRGIM